MIELVIGGARSGKSRYAENVAKHSGKEVIYLATSEIYDNEMAKRVEMHKAQRPANWELIEEPLNIAEVLKTNSQTNNCILVDCLTLWLSNCLFGEYKNSWDEYKKQLMDVLDTLPGQVIFVTNEVGCGIVPIGEVSRQFVDQAGWLHQEMAAKVAKVTLVTAGIPTILKNEC